MRWSLLSDFFRGRASNNKMNNVTESKISPVNSAHPYLSKKLLSKGWVIVLEVLDFKQLSTRLSPP